jgi:hypothetical protein
MSVIRPDSPALDGPPGGGLTLVHSVNAAWERAHVRV